MLIKFGSITATINPPNGVDNKIESHFLKYVKKQDYAIVVAEKSGSERHLHIQFWFDEPREIGTIQRAMENNQSKVDPNWGNAAKAVCRKGVKHAYNDDFYINYLNDKKEGHKILYKKIPEDTTPYYPSQEYQDKAIAIKNSADKYLCKHAFEYAEWSKNINKSGNFSLIRVAEYLSYRMYESRDLQVLRSRKAKQELCENLYWYIRGTCSTSIDSFIDYGNKKTSPLWEDEKDPCLLYDDIKSLEDLYQAAHSPYAAPKTYKKKDGTKGFGTDPNK